MRRPNLDRVPLWMRPLPLAITWTLFTLRYRFLRNTWTWTVVDAMEYRWGDEREFITFGHGRNHEQYRDVREETAAEILHSLGYKTGMWKWDHVTGVMSVHHEPPPHWKAIQWIRRHRKGTP